MNILIALMAMAAPACDSGEMGTTRTPEQVKCFMAETDYMIYQWQTYDNCKNEYRWPRPTMAQCAEARSYVYQQVREYEEAQAGE